MIQVEAFTVKVHDGTVGEVALSKTVPVVSEFMGEAGYKVFFHFMQVHAVLRALWSCESGQNIVEVEFKHGRVGFFLSTFLVPEALGLRVGFNPSDSSLLTAGQSKIVQRALVYGEKAASCTVFRSHVSDGCAVSERECFHARSEKFNEFANNTVLSEHLNDSQRHVRSRDAGLELACQPYTNDVRSEHVDRLAQHYCLCFNATNTPTQDAQSIDHGRVRVGSHEGICQPDAVFLTSNTGQEFEIDLVNNTA